MGSSERTTVREGWAAWRLASGLLLALAACGDNVGRVWDRGYGGGGGTTVESSVAAPQDLDLSLSGQPTADIVAPLGPGRPVTTPVVVVYSEAMNLQSILDEALKIERLYLREKAAQTKVRCGVNILASGRMAILRPSSPLVPGATYEVVQEAGVKDLDGRVVARTGSLGEFSVVADADQRPRVVAAFPNPNQQGCPREGRAFVVIDGPATASTVTTASCYVRNEGAAAAVAGTIAFPLTGVGGLDTRVFSFVPTEPLAGGVKHGLVLTDAIKVGTLSLDPEGAAPFSTFTTAAFQMPSAVRIGNPVAGFPDAINLTNLASLLMDATTAADAAPGDRLEIRIYGGDRRTAAAGDLRYLQREGTAAGGAVTETVDFSGALGLPESPALDDGAVTLAARLVRGSTVGAWRVRSGGLQDLLRPRVLNFGPPNGSDAAREAVSELQLCALFGKASERVGRAELNGSGGNDLFAADAGGAFFLVPWNLGRLAAPAAFTLNVTDAAGNLNETAVSGTVVQRGLLTGEVAGGTLTVEAWDLESFAPVAGAVVLVEPGTPVVPPAGRLQGVTGADGRAVFTGLAQHRYTVTLAASGYDLATVVDTKAALVSLPLEARPGQGAGLTGSVAFAAAAGRTAYVGCNSLRDVAEEGVVATSAGAPNTIPASAILPRRPAILSACVGTFPPAANPTLAAFGCPQAVVAGISTAVSPPFLAVEPGGTLEAAVRTAAPTLVSLAAPYQKDITGKGVDTADLAEGFPRVLMAATLSGLPGRLPIGVGFTAGTMANLTVNGGLAANVGSFAVLSPLVWCALEARDRNGNLGRHRELFLDYTLGIVAGLPFEFPAVPALTVPASAIGPPSIQWEDHLDPAGIYTAMHLVRVTDGAGRRWTLWVPDRDGQGTDTLQLPDLAASAVAGLAIPSTWTLAVESWLAIITGGGSEDLVLADLFRLHATFARAQARATAVQ